MKSFIVQLLAEKIIRLSSAQRERVFVSAQPVAVARQDTEFVTRLAGYIAHEVIVRDKETKWNAGGTDRAAYVPELGPLDTRADKHISSTFTLVEAQMTGDDVTEEDVRLGNELMTGVFAGGVAAVTNLPYVDQGKAMQDMVNKLRGPYAVHVAHFGLGKKVDTLEALTAEYNAAIEASPVAVTASAVQAAQDQGHWNLLETVARVMGLGYQMDNEQHQADLEKVMRVLFDEMNKTRERTRARRLARKRRAGEVEGEVEVPADSGPADAGSGSDLSG